MNSSLLLNEIMKFHKQFSNKQGSYHGSCSSLRRICLVVPKLRFCINIIVKKLRFLWHSAKLYAPCVAGLFPRIIWCYIKQSSNNADWRPFSNALRREMVFWLRTREQLVALNHHPALNKEIQPGRLTVGWSMSQLVVDVKRLEIEVNFNLH